MDDISAVRCEDVGTPDAPDHPLDQHEAWTEYLTLKQDAQFHFQWVQQTLVKLGNEMMVRKRDGIPATEADLELAKGVHEDALAMMESLSKLRQERERLDLPVQLYGFMSSSHTVSHCERAYEMKSPFPYFKH